MQSSKLPMLQEIDTESYKLIEKIKTKFIGTPYLAPKTKNCMFFYLLFLLACK